MVLEDGVIGWYVVYRSLTNSQSVCATVMRSSSRPHLGLPVIYPPTWEVRLLYAPACLVEQLIRISFPTYWVGLEVCL